jgi:hypothetical protein
VPERRVTEAGVLTFAQEFTTFAAWLPPFVSSPFLLLALRGDVHAAEPVPLSRAAESDPSQVVLRYNFQKSSGGFAADLPITRLGNEGFFELLAITGRCPGYLGGKRAIFISGNNHSDDLFMFIKNKVGGLAPEQGLFRGPQCSDCLERAERLRGHRRARRQAAFI